jgi:hypothetical protein
VVHFAVPDVWTSESRAFPRSLEKFGHGPIELLATGMLLTSSHVPRDEAGASDAFCPRQTPASRHPPI